MRQAIDLILCLFVSEIVYFVYTVLYPGLFTLNYRSLQFWTRNGLVWEAPVSCVGIFCVVRLFPGLNKLLDYLYLFILDYLYFKLFM